MQNILIIISLFFLQTFTSMAEDSNGQSLHQSHCTECHSRMTGGDGEVIYERKDSIVNSHNQLKKRVAYCAQGANTGWQQSEIELVTEYLNNQHYHY